MNCIVEGRASIENLIRSPKCSISDRIIIGEPSEIVAADIDDQSQPILPTPEPQSETAVKTEKLPVIVKKRVRLKNNGTPGKRQRKSGENQRESTGSIGGEDDEEEMDFGDSTKGTKDDESDEEIDKNISNENLTDIKDIPIKPDNTGDPDNANNPADPVNGLSQADIRLIDWDHKRTSRKKGKEDALLTQNLGNLHVYKYIQKLNYMYTKFF
jgi:hypothetical protein